MGVSVALSFVHWVIKSLSLQSADDIQALAQTLLMSYAMDNLDFKLPFRMPTMDKSADGLIHIATGTLLHLEHGVMLEDLHCSKLL